MFSFSITQQLIVFLQSFGFGFLIGVVRLLIDFIIFLLLPKRVKNIVSDLFFCLIFSLTTFCFVLAYNLGKLRLYIILGMLLGVVLFSLAPGDFIYRLFYRAEDTVSGIRRYIADRLIKIVSIFKTKLNKPIAKENESGV